MLDQSVISNPVLEQFYNHFRSRFRLTCREIEVLKVLTFLGPSNKGLAEQLKITEKTIKNHIASIQEKTNTHSTRELQALILRDTFIPLLLNVFKSTDNNPEGWKEHATISDQQTRQVG